MLFLILISQTPLIFILLNSPHLSHRSCLLQVQELQGDLRGLFYSDLSNPSPWLLMMLALNHQRDLVVQSGLPRIVHRAHLSGPVNGRPVERRSMRMPVGGD